MIKFLKRCLSWLLVPVFLLGLIIWTLCCVLRLQSMAEKIGRLIDKFVSWNDRVLMDEVVLILLLLMFSGCAQVMVDKVDIYSDMYQVPVGDSVTVKVNTLFKDIDVDNIFYKDIFGIGQYAGESHEVYTLTPWGWMRTSKSGQRSAISDQLKNGE